jgi:hypothetical protein
MGAARCRQGASVIGAAKGSLPGTTGRTNVILAWVDRLALSVRASFRVRILDVREMPDEP